jgi:hypothetical protein
MKEEGILDKSFSYRIIKQLTFFQVAKIQIRINNIFNAIF